jgi:hypothetical protein
VGQWWQPQALPHPPPPIAGIGPGDGEADEPPPTPTDWNTDSTRRLSTWPFGHSAGSEDWLIGRRASKVSSHVRQRYS